MVTEEKQLRDVNMSQWWKDFSGVTDPKARREGATLAAVCDHIARGEATKALDVAAQRRLSVIYSPQNQGKTDVAVLRELLPGDAAPAGPAGLMNLKV